ncbi:MAG: methyltransferase domain-containing protein [Myxococcota bacterium]|nr:methyltransferase domain-containing protein [Myxococcota bacterium]
MLKETYYLDDDFHRRDERDDGIFYHKDRLVQHLDAVALDSVEQLFRALIVEESPVILDLMASWDSHLPASLTPKKLIGLGLNRNELEHNHRLDGFVLHDLNRTPRLPFKNNTFDVTLNTVSVDYLVHPETVFDEVARVLKPDGLFSVVFSNRWFEPKVTNIWRRSSEPERVLLVERWFEQTGKFTKPLVYVSKGKDRPSDDKHYAVTKHSDPIYAVSANRCGGVGVQRNLPETGIHMPGNAELAARKASVSQTGQCPYCSEKLKKWAVPQTPFTEWSSAYFFICFNDHCPFYEGGWRTLTDQGNVGWSHRATYDPERDVFFATPVQTPTALRDCIVE